MLSDKQMKRYNARIEAYTTNTTEKEIETEFYNLINKYYESKYTDLGEGKIYYTAPYSIDGLLEVRTLDTDYKILVEAKANKNFNDKTVRNEVLAQAIYYCRKLMRYSELIPAIIILLEKTSMVVIETENIIEVVKSGDIQSSACEAYIYDDDLMKTLKKFNYSYNIVNFENGVDYNEVFEEIEKIASVSKYTLNKNYYNFDSYKAVDNFIEAKKLFKNNGKYYCHGDDGEVMRSYFDSIKKDFLKFSFENNKEFKIFKLDFIFTLLEDMIIETEIKHVKCGNNIINLFTKEIENKPYAVNLNEFEYNKNLEGSYSYRLLSEMLFLNKYITEDILILINPHCIKYLEHIFNLFKIDYVLNQNSHPPKKFNLIVFSDPNKLIYNFNHSKEYKFLDLSSAHDGDDIISKAINSYNNFSYDPDILPNSIDQDLIYGWANTKIRYKKDSIILMSEIFKSINEDFAEKGQARVSMRFVADQLKSHTFFKDNKMLYKRVGTILSAYSISKLDPDIKVSTHPSFLINAEWVE